MHSRAFECAFTHGFKRLKERSRVFPIRLTSDDETEEDDDEDDEDDDDASFSEYPMKALFLSIFARAVSGATNSNDHAKRKQKTTTRIFYNERLLKKRRKQQKEEETRCAQGKKQRVSAMRYQHQLL